MAYPEIHINKERLTFVVYVRNTRTGIVIFEKKGTGVDYADLRAKAIKIKETEMMNHNTNDEEG